MNTIDQLFDELLLPFARTKDKQSQQQHPPKTMTIYERAIADDLNYNVQMVRAQVSSSPHGTFYLTNHVAHITPTLPSLTEPAKEILAGLTERMNACRRQIEMTDLSEPITGTVFQVTLDYLYYLSELLPLFANNRTPFTYQLIGDDASKEQNATIQHTSLVFEYLVTLWGLASHIYRHLNVDQVDVTSVEIYTKHLNSLNFCIHVIREMLAYVTKLTKNQLSYKRFVYRVSPTSISNSGTATAATHTREELEEIQRNKDIALVTMYFGGTRGVRARLHLFYAKKYELSMRRALAIMGITDMLGECGENGTLVTSTETASHFMALSSLALQISQHYGTACKKIRDEEYAAHHYAFHRSVYWLCVANYLRASVDFYQYVQRDDRIVYGTQALKRTEIIKTTLDSFLFASRSRPHVIVAMQPLVTCIEQFVNTVAYRVKTLGYRDSTGVTLEPIEETIVDEAATPSIYEQQMALQHKRLCEDDSTQAVKRALDLLYSLKRMHTTTMTTTKGINTDSTVSMAPRIGASIEDQLYMVVLYERYNWLNLLVKNKTTDGEGDEVIMLRNVSEVCDAMSEVKMAIQENLLKNPVSSSLSNKLSSHLYI